MITESGEPRRGTVVLCTASGDYGKPRPAIVCQSDLFHSTHASFVVCPITSYLTEAPLFRIRLRASKANGLKFPSDIMVDKMAAIRRDRIKAVINRLTDSQMKRVDDALRPWLGLPGGRP